VNPVRRLDDSLLLNVNSFARSTGWLHTPLADYAKDGVVLLVVLLLAGLLRQRARPDWALAAAGWAFVATLLAVGLNQPFGHLFNEARPYATHPHLLVLASRTSDFSFPSDHAVVAGAVTGGLLLVSRRLGLFALLAGLLLCFSRVYTAAHYPWDVAGGLLLGATVALLGWLLLACPLTALTGWLRRQPVLRRAFGPPAIEGADTGAHASPPRAPL